MSFGINHREKYNFVAFSMAYWVQSKREEQRTQISEIIWTENMKTPMSST